MPDPLTILIELALQEDIGPEDITTKALFPDEEKACVAQLIAKQALVLSGLDVAQKVFHKVDHHLVWESLHADGKSLASGDVIAKISGRMTSILRAERTALNFLQHLSGVATWTQKHVTAIQTSSVKILDTRKTLPGYRVLEKKAVRDGGGHNHRKGLFDAFLIKDNHLMGRSIAEAVSLARAYGKNFLELEVDTWAQMEEALAAGVDRILLDNFSPEELKKAVAFIDHRTQTEASGGINLNNIASYAATGVDYISLGSLTHSAPAVDVSLEIIGEEAQHLLSIPGMKESIQAGLKVPIKSCKKKLS